LLVLGGADTARAGIPPASISETVLLMRWQKLLASRSSQKGTTSRKQMSDAFDMLGE
jgi:hypothetical protein